MLGLAPLGPAHIPHLAHWWWFWPLTAPDPDPRHTARYCQPLPYHRPASPVPSWSPVPAQLLARAPLTQHGHLQEWLGYGDCPGLWEEEAVIRGCDRGQVCYGCLRRVPPERCLSGVWRWPPPRSVQPSRAKLGRPHLTRVRTQRHSCPGLADPELGRLGVRGRAGGKVSLPHRVSRLITHPIKSPCDSWNRPSRPWNSETRSKSGAAAMRRAEPRPRPPVSPNGQP